MGIRTGNPRGRPKGAKNKATVERERQLEEIASRIAETVDGAFDGDSHAFLMTVYKDPSNPLPVRIDAAKAAISYEKPKLAAVEHAGDPDRPLFPAKIELVVVKPKG